jgi:hypothetical protein
MLNKLVVAYPLTQSREAVEKPAIDLWRAI